MSRTAPFLLAGLLLFVGTGDRPARADDPPPLAPVDPRHVMLYQRALRVGRNTSARHVTPEGLLAYIHRRDATPEQLSNDATLKPDVGIWSGCYAAAVACRYAVMRDAESLAEARRLAAGLDMLSRATGVPGAISRGVGRLIPGEVRGKDVVDSPLGGGLAYRGDPSRDTLSGVTLGWECLARFVDDPEVRAYARTNLGSIARRLYQGGMRIRDAAGKVTTYGALDAKIGPFENGAHAAIGCATMLAALRWDGGEDLLQAWRHLDKQGWIDSLDTQWTWVGRNVPSASNMNMVHLALLGVALEGEGKPRRNALAAFKDFRHKTKGWQNGGYMACSLLAGLEWDRAATVEELRDALLAMRPEEIPFEGTPIVSDGPFRPIELRPVNEWAWKEGPFREQVDLEHAYPSPTKTFTRADWLFAYWLARAAGELDPGPVR